ncbi:hypothetical protein HK405_000115 [Cladochytrium tenue]|nr:hypothetical protein HK405_000115 [Cladochytrium tenue]
MASYACRGVMHARQAPLARGHFGRALHAVTKPRAFAAGRDARDASDTLVEAVRRWMLAWSTRNQDELAAAAAAYDDDWLGGGGGGGWGAPPSSAALAVGMQISTSHSKSDIAQELMPFLAKISLHSRLPLGVSALLSPADRQLLATIGSLRPPSRQSPAEKLVDDGEVFVVPGDEDIAQDVSAHGQPTGAPSSVGQATAGRARAKLGAGPPVVQPPLLAAGADPDAWVDPVDDIEDDWD